MGDYEIDVALAHIQYPEHMLLNPMKMPKKSSFAGWWIVNEENKANRIYWIVGKDYSPTSNWNQAAEFLDNNLDLIRQATESSLVKDTKSLLVEALRLYLLEHQNAKLNGTHE